MSEGGSLINLGELSKPATVLIEKIADATGGIFRPYQIRRIAQAEAEAKRIKTAAEFEVAELQQRALHRFLHEEARKQCNLESITRKALPSLESTARPQDVEDDWIINFFEKCRLISDDEMQNLWAKILAGEANAKGGFSKRTVNLLGVLEKRDAELFACLRSFAWKYEDGYLLPLIYDHKDQIYRDAGLTFSKLTDLETIGLITFLTDRDFVHTYQPATVIHDTLMLEYYGSQLNIRLRKADGNQFNFGQVLLSRAGRELIEICDSDPREGFKDYVVKKWRSFGYKILKDNRANF
jgi:hypothetical protein